ncbi:MAG: carboxylating nicotinate-nucleotide diphosphorylase [Candidatus Omnitrophica bacterium]|nr:carboxylating nicotinate-nucleotide diphosphorylase [Candidatus Omnitrophota bacterium]
MLNPKEFDHIIHLALVEDAHDMDITTNFLIPAKHISDAYIEAREAGILCGLDIVQRLFKKLDPKMHFKANFNDGDKITAHDKLLELKGKTRAILTGERTALNFLCHLSGIATNTNHFVQAINPYPAQILSTRKTTPSLRKLEKYAVRCGGGVNHRLNLKEMILIKDNHREIYHGKIPLPEAILKFKKVHKEPICVEVDTLEQFHDVLPTHPNIILLDNMTLVQMKQAVKIRNRMNPQKKPLLEASGGVNLKTVRNIAKTGVDRISIGSLTHTHKALNLSMEVIR